MTEESNEDRGFTVHDRRRFDAEGRPRDDEEGAAATEVASGDPSGDPTGDASPGPQAQGDGAAPPVTFAGFIVGLATQALTQLGAAASGQAGESGQAGDPGDALREASALIDLLAVLQEKTAGNLSEDEAKLMEEILYDLRMRYVERSKNPAAEGGA